MVLQLHAAQSREDKETTNKCMHVCVWVDLGSPLGGALLSPSPLLSGGTPVAVGWSGSLTSGSGSTVSSSSVAAARRTPATARPSIAVAAS
jgi:hypothetical protein